MNHIDFVQYDQLSQRRDSPRQAKQTFGADIRGKMLRARFGQLIDQTSTATDNKRPMPIRDERFGHFDRRAFDSARFQGWQDLQDIV